MCRQGQEAAGSAGANPEGWGLGSGPWMQSLGVTGSMRGHRFRKLLRSQDRLQLNDNECDVKTRAVRANFALGMSP